MNIIPRIICCQKISGDLEAESSWQNVGQAEPLIMKTVWTSKTHPYFRFIHYRFCTIKYGPRWKRYKVVHYLPKRNQSWTFPGIPSCWASSTIMPMSSGISFHLWNQGFIWGLYSKINPGRDVKSGFIFIFKEELPELFLSMINLSGTHWETPLCSFVPELWAVSWDISSDHPLTIYPSFQEEL